MLDDEALDVRCFPDPPDPSVVIQQFVAEFEILQGPQAF